MKSPAVDTGALDGILERAADTEGYAAWWARARATGWCRHPVRLVGSTVRADPDSGEMHSLFSSADQPDRVLLKACGQRRATVCPTCSAIYRADAFQLVAAGLRGGKGIPEQVTTHPAVFATLTAPSFGPVHSLRADHGQSRPCRPDANRTCGHGQPQACHVVHDGDDPALGQPICPGCFDYPAAVLWNALAGCLWQRTTIAVRRHLARLTGIRRAALAEHARLSFAKVIEYQRRGVVHLHIVARLDGAGDQVVPPPLSFGPDQLLLAIHRAAGGVRVPYPEPGPLTGDARWGEQTDLHIVGAGGGPIPGAAAAYLAKYATKSTDPAGLLDHRLRDGDLDRLDDLLTPHLARMVRTAWGLGGNPDLADLRLRAWAHTLGFRGHWLTKSRAYSTTFGTLRAARTEWSARRHGEQPAPSQAVKVNDWHFAGRGWSTPGDAWLAETAATETANARLAAREDRRTTHDNTDDEGGNDGRA